jgi:hypothetical protein
MFQAVIGRMGDHIFEGTETGIIFRFETTMNGRCCLNGSSDLGVKKHAGVTAALERDKVSDSSEKNAPEAGFPVTASVA